jgi:hypothetical protein
MSKLSKKQMKAHNEALEILQKDVLTFDDKWDVLDKYHEGANHMQGMAGAFFTPTLLARDFAIDACGGRRVLDLCAGIGGLAFHVHHRATHWHDPENPAPEFVCIEQCAEHVEIGRKILPEATWIHASVEELPRLGLGHFDAVISNPPFGSVSRDWKGPRYTGREFEYHLIDLAADHADHGAFIIPQQSAGFRYSGVQQYDSTGSAKSRAFEKKTGIALEIGCGVDTTYHAAGWHGVSPLVEIVTTDFQQARETREAKAAPQPEAAPQQFAMAI